MRIKTSGSFVTLALTILSALTLSLAGCGGGGGNGLSTQVVSGVASVGASLSGQVSIKDASTTPKVKTTVISDDGSYAIDVTDMTAPFIVEASGSAGGTSYTLHSYSDGPGTANVNPLSEACVANASGENDPGQIYKNPDMAVLSKISSQLHISVTNLLAKLSPLLKQYGAENVDPIRDHYKVDRLGLDGLFDSVKFTLAKGVLTITDVKTGSVIFTGNIADVANWNFPSNPGPPPAAPIAPTGLTATGGAGQMTLTWTSVSNATSYNVYYATTSAVTTTSGTKITGATTPYVQTGLSAGTTYYYIVTALNSGGESAASAKASAATTAATPPPTPVPAAPTGVGATGGTKQVTISWPAVTGATSYNLYWSNSSGVTTTSGTKIVGATSPAVQTGLNDSTRYYYILTAVNTTGESLPSVQVTATTLTPTPPPTAPAAPTGLAATGGAKQVTLTWSAASGATSYNIYYSTTSGAGTGGTKISGVSSPYVQAGLSAGTTYYYVVTAQNSVGESSASAPSSAATNAPAPALPAAPAGVTATGGVNLVTVSWSAVSGATSYNIYWSTTSGKGISGTKISGATSPYLQAGLAASSSYFYVVTAVNGAGEGPASSQATATTNATAPVIPSAPTGVTATGGANQVTLSWTAVTGATSYNVYWSTTSGAGISGTKLAGATSAYLQTGLTAGTAYYYVVTAVNAAGESTASAQASATTTSTPPAFDALSYYTTSCLGCHGSLGKRTAAQITAAIANFSQMSKYRATGSSPLTAAQITAIAAASY